MRKAIKSRVDSLRREFNSRRTGQMTPPPSLEIAAKYFRLDLSDSRQREMLLFALAEITFGRGKAGRRRDSKSWDSQKLMELALADELCCYDGISDGKIAELIFAEHKEFHSVETIRRRLPEARRERERWEEFWMTIGPEDAGGEDGHDEPDDQS